MPRWVPFVVGAIGIVVLMAFLAVRDPMPGDLAGPHARVPSLVGLRNCSACHRDGDRFEQACLECHEEIAAQLAEGRGLHFSYHEDGERDCSSCHAEHLGHDFALVGEASWRGRGPAGFRHDHVDFVLDGAHASLACPACHDPRHAGEAWPAATGASAPRPMSYLGLTQLCVDCHADAHGAGTTDACEQCHDQQRFAPASRFDHDAVFALAGAHAGVSCERCHVRLETGAGAAYSGAAYSGAAYSGALADARPPVPAASHSFDGVAGTACASCHETPHVGPNEHMYGNDCRSCHGEDRFAPARFDVGRHAERFPLVGAHRTIACADCHGASHLRLEGSTPGDCARCHQNPHEPGGRGVRIADSASCARCHTSTGWRVPGFAETAHADAGFPLVGAHADVRCVSCHRPDVSMPATATGDCASCHDDPHGVDFATGCASCHRLEDRSWSVGGSRLAAEAHERAGFALTTPHAGLDCSRCHAPGGDYAVRFPGRAADDCAACHQDPHAGQFAGREGGCASCHAGAHFVPAAFTVDDHDSFPLTGAHLAVSCLRCHRKPDTDSDVTAAATAVRRFTGTPTRCASCHDNPHGTRFEDEIAIGGCQTCHTTAEDWRVQTFDHAVTGYPLLGAHARAACADCHRRSGVGASASFRRVSRDCRSCHRDPHLGQLTRSNERGEPNQPGESSCTRCHSSFTDWTAQRFDHARDSRFALDGVHRELACSDCHRQRRTADGVSYTHYRPLGRKCEDCHVVR